MEPGVGSVTTTQNVRPVREKVPVWHERDIVPPTTKEIVVPKVRNEYARRFVPAYCLLCNRKNKFSTLHHNNRGSEPRGLQKNQNGPMAPF